MSSLLQLCFRATVSVCCQSPIAKEHTNFSSRTGEDFIFLFIYFLPLFLNCFTLCWGKKKIMSNSQNSVICNFLSSSLFHLTSISPDEIQYTPPGVQRKKIHSLSGCAISVLLLIMLTLLMRFCCFHVRNCSRSIYNFTTFSQNRKKFFKNLILTNNTLCKLMLAASATYNFSPI